MQFSAPMRILPFGGCDATLGVQRLEENNPMQFVFKEPWASFSKDDQPIKLFGVKEEASLQLIFADSLSKLFSTGSTTLLGRLYSIVIAPV